MTNDFINSSKAQFNAHFASLINTFNTVEALHAYHDDNLDFLLEVTSAVLLERYHVKLSAFVERATSRNIYFIEVFVYDDQVTDDDLISITSKQHLVSVLCETATSATMLFSSLLSIAIDIA